MGTSQRFRIAVVAVVILATFGYRPQNAVARKPDTSPPPTYLFADGKRFLAKFSDDGFALFEIGNPNPIRRYRAEDRVDHIAVTADEKYLLHDVANGRLALWEIESGKQLWERSARETGLTNVYDLSFSQVGSACVICGWNDQAVILNTRRGERIAVVRFPSMQTSIMSAALSPEGRSGVLIELGGRLHTFDATTGSRTDTGLTGAWPVRYSADGKFIAFGSDNSGPEARLRIVSMDGTLKKTDVGTVSHIGHIRPAPDGTFLVTARSDNRTILVGARVRPQEAVWEELWHRPFPDFGIPPPDLLDERTDFDPSRMIGVSTSWRLETIVVDLKTGNILQTLDNSGNRFSGSRNERSIQWVAVGAGVVVLCVLVWVWFTRSRANAAHLRDLGGR